MNKEEYIKELKELYEGAKESRDFAHAIELLQMLRLEDDDAKHASDI